MIKEHYHLTYGEGTRLEESAEAAATKLTYYDIPDKDEEPDHEEESEGRNVTITMPLTPLQDQNCV